MKKKIRNIKAVTVANGSRVSIKLNEAEAAEASRSLLDAFTVILTKLDRLSFWSEASDLPSGSSYVVPLFSSRLQARFNISADTVQQLLSGERVVLTPAV